MTMPARRGRIGNQKKSERIKNWKRLLTPRKSFGKFNPKKVPESVVGYIIRIFGAIRQDKKGCIDMDEFLKQKALEALNNARATWCDLPKYVYSKEYEEALFSQYLEKRVAAGQTDVERDIIFALDHETGDKCPYFEFDRSSSGVS